MSRSKRRLLADAIKQEQERIQLQAEVDWTMQAIHFLRDYQGEHPTLRSLAARQRRIRNWVPTERQVIQIHRIAHRERIELKQLPNIDSLGRKLKRREQADLPDSLDEPTWL